MGCSLKVDLSSGEPCPPFYRPRGSRGYRWEKEEKTKGIGGPSKDPGLPFFPRLSCLTWQTVLEVAWLLIFIGHVLAPFSKWVRPIPSRWMVWRAGERNSDPSGSNRGSDHTSVTIDDVSSVLDHSGRRMPVLVSTPED